ncbi:MAG: hypothetical protein QOI63_826 [Thermoplasmata archaeon]|jgi:hypothetical protein|nr:hypothetical protein [Thermoplasmata archaeon]
MRTHRVALTAGLLALALLALTPAVAPAAASPDNVWVCVIGVKGGCQPYDGHLAEVHVKNHEVDVPDPCYTTACF